MALITIINIKISYEYKIKIKGLSFCTSEKRLSKMTAVEDGGL